MLERSAAAEEATGRAEQARGDGAVGATSRRGDVDDLAVGARDIEGAGLADAERERITWLEATLVLAGLDVDALAGRDQCAP